MKFYATIFVFLWAFAQGYAQAAGTIDVSFGDNGFKSMGVGTGRMTELPDKRLLIRMPDGLARLKAADYTLDSSFADAGFIRKSGYFFPTAFGVLPDGRIMVLFYYNTEPSATYTFVRFARFSADGIQDMSYGTNGFTEINIQSKEMITDMLVHPNGSVFVTGWAGNQIHEDGGIFIIHVGAEGELTYPNNGIRLENLPSLNYDTGIGTSLAVLPDGKVVLGGYILPENTVYESIMYMLRYQENGQPDSFGTNGYVADNVGSYSYIGDLAVGVDGKIYALADSDNASSLIVRYNSDGTRDNSFGTQGVNKQDGIRGTSILLQPDGKSLVGGYVADFNTPHATIRRVKANGTKDNTFSGDGLFSIPFDTLQNFMGRMAYLSSGKLLFSIFSGYHSTSTLIRLHLGLIVAAEEPFAPEVKVAALHPNVFLDRAPLRVSYTPVGDIDPVAIVVGTNGIVANTSITVGSDGYLEAEMPAQLSSGTYQLMFMDGNEAVRAQFVKVN